MKNKAKCNNCNDILESKHRHDWVSCTCFKKHNKIIENYFTKYGADSTFKELQDNAHGIYIDGGDDYFRAGYFNANDFIRLEDNDNE